MNIAPYITRQTPTIIEAGTGNGEDLIEYSGLYPQGKIYAFEPNARQYHITNNNLQLFQRHNVELYGNALGAKSGEILDFYVSDRFGEPWGASSLLKPKDLLHSHPDLTFKEVITAKTLNLDDFVKKKNIAYIDCLELDLQGYEPVVLMAAPITLKSTRVLFSEVNLSEQYEGNILYPQFKEFLLDNSFECKSEELDQQSKSGNVIYLNKNLPLPQ